MYKTKFAVWYIYVQCENNWYTYYLFIILKNDKQYFPLSSK